MSNRYKGGVISATPPTLVAGAGASGAWTLEQQMQATAAGLWPVNGPFYIEDVFSTWLYTGTGAARTITNGINLSANGGLVWFKSRSGAYNHALIDTARGGGQVLSSNTTSAQVNYSPQGISAFNTNGFTFGTTTAELNNASNTYASWTFREQPKFFDIVTWSGTGGVRTLTHNLGSTPGSIFVKKTIGGPQSWAVYHRSLGATKGLALDLTNAADIYSGYWNNTEPTATQFTVGSPFNMAQVDDPGATYIAYLFAHNAGGFGLTGTDNVVSCGSYTGNGAAGGQLINLGYEAQWVMIKQTNVSGGGWWMMDVMRGYTVNGDFGGDASLYANTSQAEQNNVLGEPASQGFRPIQDNVNQSGQTYIYIAIRRGPMKVPTLGTSVFNVDTYNQTSASDPAFNLGKVADAGLRRLRDFEDSWRFQSRLTGNGGLITSTSAAESTQNFGNWDNNVGWYQGAAITPPYSQANWYGWTFARAPSFFDVVCYTGTGSVTTFSHNLGVVPELMIVKRRSAEGAWTVNSQYLAADARLELQSTSAVKAPPEYGDAWNNTRPTSTVFTVSTGSDVNASGGTYVNYLFATCAGVSKVGSYTGTGAAQTINCGFTAGSRFVMIKRTDSTGDWYVWDSARGIIPSNDPYLLLNSTAAEVTGTDYVDTTNVGFDITSTAPAAINANGGTFIFLAIA